MKVTVTVPGAAGRRGVIAAAAAVGLLALAGCSGSPTGPAATSASATSGTPTTSPSTVDIRDTNPAGTPIPLVGPQGSFALPKVEPISSAGWQAADLISAVERYHSGASFTTVPYTGAGGSGEASDQSASWTDSSLGLTMEVDISRDRANRVMVVNCRAYGASFAGTARFFTLCADAQYPGAQPAAATAFASAQIPVLQQTFARKSGTYFSPQPSFGEATMYVSVAPGPGDKGMSMSFYMTGLA